jgi:CheY-like chemotaxis protein
MSQQTKTVHCPKCGWSDVRVSHRTHFWDHVLGVFAMAPLRCRKCRLRFYRPWFLVRDLNQTSEVETRSVPQPPVPIRRSVLVVDEDVAVRELLARLLSREGYLVLEAAGPGDATEEMMSNRVDAVLANLSESEQVGVIDACRAADPGISIITLSCTARLEAAADGKLLTLPRPASPNLVVRRVREMLNAL